MYFGALRILKGELAESARSRISRAGTYIPESGKTDVAFNALIAASVGV